MSNFVFKIFGAPHTFDLYQGSEEDIGYFQNFDNGGKENVKLTIHRMASGKVSYSYLRYNFISGKGRANSFFGMSVLFHNQYCGDIEGIFELFDTIYQDIILKNGILLTELKDNSTSTAQAKYCVDSFAQAEAEVKNVERNFINNLNQYFANDILPIDGSFLESNSMMNLNDRMDNAKFVSALRRCSWVHIASDYGTNEEPTPSLEFLEKIDSQRKKLEKDIFKVSVEMHSTGPKYGKLNDFVGETDDLLRKINAWLLKEYQLQNGTDTSSYLQKQPKLKKSYDKLCEYKDDLNKLSAVKTTAPAPTAQPVVDANPPQPVAETPKLGTRIKPPFWQAYMYQIALTTAAIFVIVPLLINPTKGVIVEWLTEEKKTDTTAKIIPTVTPSVAISKVNVDSLVKLGDTELAKSDFDKAIEFYKQAGDTNLVKSAESKAVKHYTDKADTQVNKIDRNTNSAKKIEYWKEAIAQLEKTKNYGDDPTATAKIVEYNNNIVREQKKIDAEKATKKEGSSGKTKASPCTTSPVIITITKNRKQSYRVGEKFTVTVKSGGQYCTDGVWGFGYEDLKESKGDNNTEFEIINKPISGKLSLRYNIGGDQKASLDNENITIINNSQ